MKMHMNHDVAHAVLAAAYFSQCFDVPKLPVALTVAAVYGLLAAEGLRFPRLW